MSNPVSLKAQVAILAAQMETLVKALSASVPVPAIVPNGPVSISAKAPKRQKKAKVYANPANGKISVNSERGGVEIEFGGPVTCGASLKAAGYFYNPATFRWYHKVGEKETVAGVIASAKALISSVAV